MITPISHRARLIRLTYADSANGKTIATRWGIIMEDGPAMAARLGGKLIEEPGASSEDLDGYSSARTGLFQYMIGNTDYSLSYLHNYRIVQTDTSMAYYPMAYDFDWSGLVNSPYAKPDYRLPVKRVTDRLYRGGCHSPELLNETLGFFRAKKDAMYGHLKGIKDLTPERLKEATDYLDEFYKMSSDPGQVNRELRRVCDR